MPATPYFLHLNFTRFRESLDPSVRDALTRSPTAYAGDPAQAAEDADQAADAFAGFAGEIRAGNLARFVRALDAEIVEVLDRLPPHEGDDPAQASRDASRLAEAFESLRSDFEAVADRLRDEARTFRELAAERAESAPE